MAGREESKESDKECEEKRVRVLLTRYVYNLHTVKHLVQLGDKGWLVRHYVTKLIGCPLNSFINSVPAFREFASRFFSIITHKAFFGTVYYI